MSDKNVTIYGLKEMSDILKKWVTKIGALTTRLIRTKKKRQREKTGIYPAFFMIKLNYIKITQQYTIYIFWFLFGLQ